MMGLDATEEAEGGVQQPWFAIKMWGCACFIFVLSNVLGIVLLSVSWGSQDSAGDRTLMIDGMMYAFYLIRFRKYFLESKLPSV